MDKIESIFNKHKGRVSWKGLIAEGISDWEIKKAVDSGLIENYAYGQYKLVDYPWDENEYLVDVCFANKKAVICLLSAANYWDLTTFIPGEIYAAFPEHIGRHVSHLPGVKPYYFSEKLYNLGIEEIKTGSGLIRIYNKEKTVVDLFRYCKKLGEDIAIESLRNYISRRPYSIAKLSEYSIIAKTEKILVSILKGLLEARQ